MTTEPKTPNQEKPTSPACERCTYYAPIIYRDPGDGECHRYAPRPTLKPPSDNEELGRRDLAYAWFPVVATTGWCGEFKEKVGAW